MSELFNLRRADGKIVAQHHTRELALRELEWQRESGAQGRFTVERIERECDYERWGYGYPNRFAGRWCSAKLAELKRRYDAGELTKSLAEYFGSNAMVISRMARRMGCARRIGATDEEHNGYWTSREEKLINYMYDSGISVGQISESIPRTRNALENRLRLTAPTLSTRRKNGRFVTPGRHKVWPVLESPGQYNEFKPSGRASRLPQDPEV